MKKGILSIAIALLAIAHTFGQEYKLSKSSGKLVINGTAEVNPHYVFAFHNDGNGFGVEALEDSIFLVASGQPLNEPVSTHGPFVMSNETEILQAFRDYQMGKMGVLIEE